MKPTTTTVLLSLLASFSITLAARSALETEQYKALADQLHFDPAEIQGIQMKMAGNHKRQGGDDSGGDDDGGDDDGSEGNHKRQDDDDDDDDGGDDDGSEGNHKRQDDDDDDDSSDD
ncbi:hypothetical protein OIDMADRAFT_27697 [Oidiodendron maius Zn]|uniref:Uncharacterized protein n=1 Tax=Oidiodendron maius (strain Zn) TaxID=913774 RepID=A0A0C3HLP5_OIDMZ|nr:hypothetical protein OIDMADRAFT_27697 [Oidiodendron maius Zn]